MSKQATNTADKGKRKQSRTIGLQTALPALRDAALEWARERQAVRIAWAKHPVEGDKPEHYHLVLEFGDVVDWTSLRRLAMEMDSHSWSDSLSKPAKSRRYLGHRDNPLKAQIPESDIHFEGEWTEQDIAEALAPSPSAGLECLVRELANYGASRVHPAAALIDLLRKGYEPREVSSVVGAYRSLDAMLCGPGANSLSRALAPSPSGRPTLTPDDPAFFEVEDDPEDSWRDLALAAAAADLEDPD